MKRKFTFLIAAALMLLTMMATTGTMWGQAAVNTTLWEETWTGGDANETPSAYGFEGTTVYGNATLTYAQSSTNTKLYAETLAGGTSPELLLSKSNQTWTISNIPTGQATEMSLTFLSNKATFDVTSTTTGITISGSEKSWTISANNVTSFNLTIKNTGSSNARVDNILLKVTTAGGGSGDLEDSDLAITDAPVALVFDMNNNSAAQTVSYTTSSTGAITISPATSDYFTLVHDTGNKTITVTPLAVTPSAQTVTINQAPNATYAAGSAEFTVSITNSAPQYTVTYKANGGTGDDIPVQYYAGDNVTVADNTFSYAGHAFTKWNTIAGGTGTDYEPGTVIENISADIDLYAQWEESDETIDVLNYAFTGISGTSYSAWSGKTGASGAVYAGRSGGDHNSIQLNSSSPNGIVSTTSGGKFTKVVVTWNSSTSNNRSVQIYGKNTAYEGSADLYDNDKKGTLIGSIVKGTSTELTISNDYNYIGIKNPGSAIYMDEVKITWVPDTDPAVATTVTIDDSQLTNTDVYTSTEAGSLSATVNAGETPIQATVTWESSNTEVATIGETTGIVTLVAAGSTTITASYAGESGVYKSSSATYNLTVINSNAPGSQNHPYTVAEARAAIDAGTGITNVYATGIISQVDSYNSTYHSITYWISGDGETTSDQLQVYSGKGLNNTDFSSIDDVKVGATVVVCGNLKKHNNTTYEFDYNNYLTSYTAPQVTVEAPTFSVTAGGYATEQTVAITCATEGAQIYYTNDGSDPTNESFLYDEEIDIEETTTIKAIAYVGENASTVSTAAYYILSNENTYTVTQALEFETYPQNNIFVEGIVSTAPTSLLDGGLLTYYISVDGTETNRLQVYKGKNLGNIEFTAADNIQVGDVVTIFGNVKVYNNQKEFDQGNYLVTWERLETVATPTFTPAEGEYTEAQSVIIACTTDDATIYYKTAENEEWAVYSEAIDVDETTTIWAYAAKEGMNSSAVATATYTINIPVFTPSITVDPALVEATAEGGEGTLTVTYENITEIIAEVYFCDAEGEAASYDWITAEINNENNVEYLIVENDGEARTAYFKVWALDDEAEDVYSDLVIINQAAYVGPSQEVTDVLNNSFTGVTGTTYSAWTNTGTSGAVYAGNSAGGNDAIQLRSNNSNSGIVTTTSGGKVTKVEVTWNGNTSSGRKIDIYGKNTAYEAASDLYGDNQGTKLGTIEYDNNTALIITDDYEFIGIRSNSGALYLDEIQITWSTGSSTEPSITVADATVEVPAEGEDNGILALTYANLTITEQGDFDIQYYDENGDELGKDDQPDWMEASIQAAAQEGYEVSYSVIENEGEARTAYFKVYALDDNAEYVYSNLVTISQAAYVAPVATITVYPLDIQATAAETVDWLAITLENIDITEDGGGEFDLVFCDNDGNPLSEKPAWFEFDFSFNDVWSMPYTILANTETTARTLYFKIYGLGDDGETEAYSDLVTVTQAGYVVDYAELPFEWEGGTTADFNALTGTSTNGVGDYAESHGVYRMKLDSDGDYIMVKTNSQPGIVTIGVKMIGGGNTSTITVQGSADGESFTDIEELTISGNQNDVLNLETTNDFATTDRYVRLYFNKGSNVGVGPITIAQVDLTPSITVAPATLNLNCDGGDGELTVTHKNLADDPQLAVIFVESDGETQTTCDWIEASINANGNVAGHIDTNTGEARTAYLKVTGRDAENNLIKSNLVTFNQAAYTEPSIVFETTTLDIVAGGENRTMSFDYEGLGQNPTFSINFYESDGTTAATYPWLTAVITPEEKVDITISDNEGAARSAYFKVSGVNGEVNALSNLVTINQAAFVQLATYSLVTNVDQIVSGKHYLFVGYKGEVAYAMGYDKGNNRNAVEVTVDNNTIPETVGAYEFVINNSSEDWTIYDNNVQELNTNDTYGFLYAAGGTSNNYLKTRTTNNDDKGIWTITIDDETHVASITAKSTGRNKMRFNDGNSPLFSCYSDGQKDIYLYVKDNDNNLEYYGTEITYSGHSIPDGGSITVGAGSVMTVPNNFENTDPTALIIEDGGQLIHTNELAATLQKNITAASSWKDDVDGWYFIASPVNNLSTSAVTGSGSGTYDLFAYDEPYAYWRSNTGTGAPFTELERGKGYLYANKDDVTLNFAGMMVSTNESISLPLSYACEYTDVKGYNLMGNPFTRNLTTGDITKDGVALTTYYGINAATTGMEAKLIANEPIKPGQGFFVQVESTDENHILVFNPSKKDETVDNGYICIAAGNENNMDKAYVQIKNGNTLRKMNIANMMEVYVMNDGDDYAAARVEELAGTMPVHFKAVADGEFTITINAKNIEASTMMLFDDFTGEQIDLLETPSYTFFANESDDAARFTLMFDFNDYTGINESYVNGNFAYQNGDELLVSGEGTLQVFDVMGRFVMNKEIHGNESISVSAFETGVYMLRFVGENIMTQKIVVR